MITGLTLRLSKRYPGSEVLQQICSHTALLSPHAPLYLSLPRAPPR